MFGEKGDTGLGIIRTDGASMKAPKQKEPPLTGRFVVTDPSICHGKPTFRGTRIFVADVLEQVAAGMDWDSIVEEWRGSVSKEAIAEAVRLASLAFLDHSRQYTAPDRVHT